MNVVYSKDLAVISIPKNEILRYMRAREETDKILQVVSEAEKLVLDVATCRVCWTEVEIRKLSENSLTLGNIKIVSADLSKRLWGCNRAFVFAATVGVGVDRVIRSSEIKSTLLSLACDAAGSALVEAVCDIIDKELAEKAQKQEKQTSKRFSAGYGDLSLEYQRDICALLDTPRNIGASLTDGVMMAPSKTVTAIIGIK